MQDIYYENPIGSFLFSFEKRTGFVSMNENHYHDSYELYYLLSGYRNYFIKDRMYKINKGDLVLINIHDLHRTIDAGTPAYERFLINFKPKILMSCDGKKLENIICLYSKGIPVIRLSVKQQAFIEDLLFKMHREANSKAFGFEEIILTYLVQMLIFSNRNVDEKPPIKYLESNPGYEKVSLIIQYINEHYMEHLNLLFISEYFYISPFYFCKVFKSCTGFTFIEYLNNMRIKEARKLLRETKFSVLTISEKVGFGSISHFNRVFRGISGFSPLLYRKTEMVK